jgi:hypothetical protein
MQNIITWCSKNLLLLLLASFTLGLAPFFPEPHIWQKLKWLFQGAVGFKPIDWFDLFLHGSPWLLLGLGLAGRIAKISESKKDNLPKN